jgi:hypothetical protein
MFDKNSSLQYHVFKDYNIQFDEKGTTCGTVRKVQWVREGKEPDEEKAKIEIRHVTVNDSGETPLKGYAFSTPEGPGELIVGMIDAGFGDTKEILRAVRKREDFLDAANTINEDDDFGDGETFDMRDLLLGIGEEDLEDAS